VIILETVGRIHSFETCGTVDGPGIRVVIFMQGCYLRCKYCHNPDTWNMNNGNIYTVEETLSEILKYEVFMKKSGGGVTISGGEPLLQAKFLEKLFIELKKKNINIAIDTSGNIDYNRVKDTIQYVDLFLLDIKSMYSENHFELTKAKLELTLKFLENIDKLNKVIWLRHVFIPGITGSEDELIRIKNLKKNYKSITKIEILPFHKIGEYKWEEMGYEYTLKEQREPTAKEIKIANEIIK